MLKEPPESVILILQKQVWSLVDQRESLLNKVAEAQRALADAKSNYDYNESQILDVAEFLQDWNGDAVKDTWFNELGISDK